MVDEEASQYLGGQKSTALSSDAVHQALDRLLGDPRFKASSRNRRFLKYVVDASLAGHSELIKSYSIAVDVLGRKPSFDPAIDPIVRIEATRLRSALNAYYARPGADDEIRIDLPTGHYVPTFHRIETPTPIAASALPLETAGRVSPLWRAVKDRRWIPTIGLVGLVIGLAVLVVHQAQLTRLWATNNPLVLLEPTTPMTNAT